MKAAESVKRVAFLGTFPPRRCGIGTFTSDLSEAIARRLPQSECWVLAMSQEHERLDYPARVRFQVQQNDVEDYRRAAMFLKIYDFDVVSLQHEFGIFGGPDGEMLMEFMRSVRVPIVTTMHTVLQNPSPNQRRITEELAGISSRIVVMSSRARDMLHSVYDIEESKLDLIMHGIPELPFIDPDFDKGEFGTLGKTVLLTFGLISPGKGIEVAIKAMPKILAKNPNVHYFVIGATHPNVLREQGEAYREMLHDLCRELDIESAVTFVNEFVSIEDLVKYIGASDIYVTPYPSREQISSGALSYAVGLGKAVVSTPYWYAEELLAEDRGVLVPFNDPEALAAASLELIESPERRLTLRKSAYSYSRTMVWRTVAERYIEVFARARDEARLVKMPGLLARQKETRELPPLNLSHLQRMSDRTGIIQYATYTTPNYDYGYTTEDNARALILMTKLREMPELCGTLALEWYVLTYMAFLWHAFDKERIRFRPRLGFDRRWREQMNYEEAHGWAMRAIGYVLGGNFPERTEGVAGYLWELALQPTLDVRDLRAAAHTIVGIDRYLRRFRGDLVALGVLEALSERLMDSFAQNADQNWRWFDHHLTRVNAVLPQALLVAGKWLDDPERTHTGLEALHWLFDIQTIEGRFVPIGTRGGFPRGGDRARYDQTPTEAATCISAALDAFEVDSNREWLATAKLAFDWFLGLNDLNTPLYDPDTGGCRDGLQSDRVNQNEGAEATLSYLISHLNMYKRAGLNELTDNEGARTALMITQPGGVGDGAGSPV